MGILTYNEFVEEISKCKHEDDAQIIADAINEVKESDEYKRIKQEFLYRLGELYKDNLTINDIVQYHIRKAYIK